MKITLILLAKESFFYVELRPGVIFLGKKNDPRPLFSGSPYFFYTGSETVFGFEEASKRLMGLFLVS